ncbi:MULTISPECIES: helix-turn-helix domain-containing protein [unclassified Gordonia (in: high G+C Gram-positive bacteria)]
MTESAPIVASECTDRAASTAVAVTTRELASSEGRELWAETLDSTFCEMDVDWPGLTSPFGGDIVARPVGDLALSVVRAEPHTVVRTPAMIESDPVDCLLLCLITKGTATIAQGSRRATLDHGAFGVVDALRPFVVSGVTEFEQVVLRVPRELVAGRIGSLVDDALGVRVDASGGVGRIASSILVDLASHDDDLGAGPVGAVASAMLDVVSAALTYQVPGVSATERAHAEDLRAVQQEMLRHIADPDITLADVADRLGMSVRYVHKLFGDIGVTPRTWLYSKRFERSSALLTDTDRNVGAIASELGFRDVSHFSRAFSKHFGVSPSRFRAGR